MDIWGIVIATIVVGATGIVIGLLLGVAGEKFKVEVNEKELFIRDLLPGNNCGGCGFAGCDALAKAIAAGEAPVNACPVGGADCASRIGEVMGVADTDTERKVAFVKCSGTCDKVETEYNYYGTMDCKMAAMVPGRGSKKCIYGCMGYGTCERACPFDAIHVVDGVAVVDKEKCVACGKCVAECPNRLIELVPYTVRYMVSCSSRDKGKDVKAVCSAGCIGCGICVKQCEYGAIVLEDNIAHIDQSKCVGCGKCAAKCPSKVIRKVRE